MCGLAYDSTVGFADRVGFRAGTCLPYHPWLLQLDREAQLTEIPLIVMEKTLIRYMGLTPQESLEEVRSCVARCRTVGGVFTLLWHNTTLDKSEYRSLYMKMLSQLSGAEGFNWRNGSTGLC